MEVFVSILIVFIFLRFNDNPPSSLIVRKCRVNDYLTCCFVRFAQGYPSLVNSKIKIKKDFAENIFVYLSLNLLDILIVLDVFEAYLEVKEVLLSADSADGS